MLLTQWYSKYLEIQQNQIVTISCNLAKVTMDKLIQNASENHDYKKNEIEVGVIKLLWFETLKRVDVKTKM